MARPPDVVHALNEWREMYPDKNERIQALRRELHRCRGMAGYPDRHGRKRPREYPQTEKLVKRMLELLEGGASS